MLMNLPETLEPRADAVLSRGVGAGDCDQPVSTTEKEPR
jgi:hypothetical protein